MQNLFSCIYCLQMLTQPGCSSLDEDLQLLAAHAAPGDRKHYATCRTVYLKVIWFVYNSFCTENLECATNLQELPTCMQVLGCYCCWHLEGAVGM